MTISALTKDNNASEVSVPSGLFHNLGRGPVSMCFLSASSGFPGFLAERTA